MCLRFNILDLTIKGITANIGLIITGVLDLIGSKVKQIVGSLFGFGSSMENSNSNDQGKWDAGKDTDNMRLVRGKGKNSFSISTSLLHLLG